jgi:hypothetical protein
MYDLSHRGIECGPRVVLSLPDRSVVLLGDTPSSHVARISQSLEHKGLLEFRWVLPQRAPWMKNAAVVDALATSDDEVVVFANAEDRLLAYRLDLSNGDCSPPSHLGDPRFAFSLARTFDGGVLLIGGAVRASNPSTDEVSESSEVTKIDTTSLEVVRRERMISARASVRNRAFPIAGRRTLVYGGDRGVYEATVGRSSFEIRTADGVWELGRARSLPRFWPSVGPLSNGDLLIAGGGVVDREAANQSIGWDATTSCEQLSLDTMTFSRIAPLPAPRSCATLVTLVDGRTVLIGGTTCGLDDPSGGRALPVVIYHPAADRWDAGAPLAETRIGPLCAQLGSLVLVAGGGNEYGEANSVEVLQLEIEVETSSKATTGERIDSPRRAE